MKQLKNETMMELNMRYAQIRFTDEEFIKLKKVSLDDNLTFEEFLKNAIKDSLSDLDIFEGIENENENE